MAGGGQRLTPDSLHYRPCLFGLSRFFVFLERGRSESHERLRQSTELKAAAYAGTYVVVLAWDTLDGKKPARNDLLGYAIERAEFDLAGNEVERYWMRGIKRFKDKDKGTAARHAGLHRRASDPELPLGRLHGQGGHPLPIPDRSGLRHGEEPEARRRGGGDARCDDRDRGRSAARRRTTASATTSSSIAA